MRCHDSEPCKAFGRDNNRLSLGIWQQGTIVEMGRYVEIIAIYIVSSFLPRDAMQSVVMPQYVVSLSVSLSVRLSVSFRRVFHAGCEHFENNFTAE